MIKLDIQDYCQNCRLFESETDSSSVITDGNIIVTNHIVRCRHAEFCKDIREYHSAGTDDSK